MTSSHFLRIPSPAYRAIALGSRRVLVLDRQAGVLPGDYLILREWRQGPAGGAFTGAWMVRRVTDELADAEGLLSSHAVYSFNGASENESVLTALKRKFGFAERRGVSPERFWRDLESKESTRRVLLRRSLERVARVKGAARELDPGPSS